MAADSYPEFEDTLEFDRHRTFFAEVRGDPDDHSTTRQVTVIVWTRLHADAGLDWLKEGQPNLKRELPPQLSPGPIRTVFSRRFKVPGLVRITPTAVAILDYHPSNYGGLKNGPAVQVISFDGKMQVSLRLDEVFKNATERYHNGRGQVNWLRDAWFDESGRRIFIVSGSHSSNEHGREVAILSLPSGKIQLADTNIVKEQITSIEPRFLHTALDVGMNYSVAGLDGIANRIFEDKASSLPAKLRAAAHLSKSGDIPARELIRALADLQSVDPAKAKHPLLSESLVFENDYWWNTIGYAAKMATPLAPEQKNKMTSECEPSIGRPRKR